MTKDEVANWLASVTMDAKAPHHEWPVYDQMLREAHRLLTSTAVEPTRELEIPEGCWCGACGEPWTWPMSQPCPKCGNRTRLGPPAKPPAGFNCPLCGKPIEQCVSDLAREAYPGFLRPLYETVDWEPGQPISIPIPDGTYCMHEGYSGPTANCPKHGSSGNRPASRRL